MRSQLLRSLHEASIRLAWCTFFEHYGCMGVLTVWKFANVAVHLNRVSGCWLTSTRLGLSFLVKTRIYGDLARNRQLHRVGSKTRSLTLELTWNGTSQDNLLIRRSDQWRLRLVSGYTLIGNSRFQDKDLFQRLLAETSTSGRMHAARVR